ncbi:MAG TPA: HAMP domain-containing sensor histidine kinase, partial [Polyangia bacterium]|nr:HAMP domain-containing sensor histidine kinase [Polyangia bacterium]
FFVDAALYDTKGVLFASFASGGAHDLLPPPADVAQAAAGTTIDGDRITVVRPVAHGHARFGTLVLHTAAAPLTRRVHAYLWGLLWLVIGVIAASVFLAAALERIISRRLGKLADMARKIAQSADYGVRADDAGGDEIGQLADAFNHMLQEIGHRQEQARQAVRVRDEFLSVASHELKTPLTSLKLQVQSLIEMPPTIADRLEAKRVASSFALTERQVRRLERLINNLLDVSRIAVGRFGLQLEDADLSASIRDVAAQLSAELARSGSTLTLHLPDTALGHWDPLRLEQVVVNLMTNAVKYGEGKPIDVTLELDERKARLMVRDHGIGVAAADHERIFGRFERAVSLNYGGLGLGLYITRQIVLAHGGTIRVDSKLGDGSTFIVELDRAGPTETPAANDNGAVDKGGAP